MTTRERIVLMRASSEMHVLFANLLELYSHDLSDAFGIDVGADGRFGYEKLQRYWSEPDTHYAFLFRCDDKAAGFALITRGSPMSDDASDLDMAEFFVLRKYRRMGVGREAACALWDTLPGRWVVRVSEGNRTAVPFWIDVVQRYTAGNYKERTQTIAGRAWRVFTFHTADCSAEALS